MVVAVLAVIAVVIYLAIPLVHSAVASTTTVSPPTVVPRLDGRVTFPGTMPSLPWPATGEGAVAVEGEGLVASTGDEQPVPIASVTKMMTAYLVLKAHPITGDQSGPTLTMTAADAALYSQEVAQDDSTLEVTAGEQLTERQLLEALLIPSADNIARLLAVWDAGSVTAFVQQMNAEAAALGMTETHYADPSGLSPQTVSTAADQAILAGLDMENPVFASIVDHTAITLPLVGRVTNYNPVVGEDGIVGVKSGYTGQALACLVVAAPRTVDGHTAMVIVATLGQPNGLPQAASEDIALLNAVTPTLEAEPVLKAAERVGSVRVSWSHRSTPVEGPPTSTVVVGWPGLSLTEHLVGHLSLTGRRRDHLPAPTTDVGTIEVTSSVGTVRSVPALLGGRLPPLPKGDVFATARSRAH
jgi:D-alanyl-D-alanine carboxypeptidase (penicillin-binding protein 5/6)